MKLNVPPVQDLKALARNGGVSVRALRDRLKDPLHPLPHFRVGGKILVRWDEYLNWLESYRVDSEDLGKVVENIMGKIAR